LDENVFCIPNIASAPHVPIRDAADFTPDMFREQFLLPARPVLVRGAASTWPCTTRWQDEEYLRREVGSHPVRAQPSSKIADHRIEGTDKVTMASYIDILARDPEVYMGPAANRLPEQLETDIGELSFFKGKADLCAWFVGRAPYTGCHEHNGWEAFMIQVVGPKLVCLYEPNTQNDEALYAGNHKNWSPVDFRAPDLQQYPRLAEGYPWIARVNVGDALFIPDPWWHAVAGIDDKTSVTLALFFHRVGLDPWSPPTRRSIASKFQKIFDDPKLALWRKMLRSLRVAASVSSLLMSRATFRRVARHMRLSTQ
jgi:hypothetical protein